LATRSTGTDGARTGVERKKKREECDEKRDEKVVDNN